MRTPARGPPTRASAGRAPGGAAGSLVGILARRWLVAAAVFGAVLGGSLLCAWAGPKRWQLEVQLLAEEDPATAALGYARRGQRGDAESPTAAARDIVLSHDSLVALVQHTDLLRRMEEPPSRLHRAARAVLSHLVPPASEERRREDAVKLLEERLYVKGGESGLLYIGIQWTDRDTAYQLLKAAHAGFMDVRFRQETAGIEEVIALLEKHAVDARAQVAAALAAAEKLEAARRAREAGNPASASAPPRPGAAPAAAGAGAPEAAAQRESARASIATLDRAWRQRVSELEARWAELTTRVSEQHPAAVNLKQALDDLRANAPRSTPLDGEGLADGGDPQPGGSRGWAAASEWTVRRPRAPSAVPADEISTRREVRSALAIAVKQEEVLRRRLENARIELDVARIAFNRRYTVVHVVVPRTPVTPNLLLVVLGGFLGALSVAVFAAAGVDRCRRLGARPGRATALVLACTAVLAMLTVAAVALTSNVVVALAAPPVCAAAVWTVWTRPVRDAVLALMFLALALESKGDASGRWSAPWAVLGHLLNNNLNLTLPVRALGFTGIDAAVALFLALLAWRRLTRSGVDADGGILAPRPLLGAAVLSLVTVLALIARGLARGGDLVQAMWQCHQLAFVPIVFFLFQGAFRGPRDFPGIAKVVVAAALVKAMQAAWVRHGVSLPSDVAPTATSHGDSMLLAGAVCVLVALAVEYRTRKVLLLASVALPVLAVGMLANNRRLAWVEIAFVLVAMYAITPATRAKRALTTAGLVALPVFCLYVAAGWNSTSRAFAPAAKIRSIVDSKYDRSTETRDVENYNLVANWREQPIVGMGFGREYHSFVSMDDISHAFAQWRFIPHNSVLGLLAFGGIVGLSGVWLVLAAGVFFAARSHRWSRDPRHRAAALSSLGGFVIYLVQCYGDMGLVSWQGVFLLAPALTVAGKLAVHSGAWRASARSSPGGAPAHSLERFRNVKATKPAHSL